MTLRWIDHKQLNIQVLEYKLTVVAHDQLLFKVRKTKERKGGKEGEGGKERDIERKTI